MRRKLYYFQLIVVLSLMLVVLFERVDWIFLLLAPLISMATIYFSETFLLHDSYYDLFYFNIFKSIPYLFTLLLEIYRAGFKMILVVLQNSHQPEFVEISTDLDQNFETVILCNSITLTPGTITVDIEGQRLLVLWMNPTTQNPSEAGEMIKGKLERRIKKGL